MTDYDKRVAALRCDELAAGNAPYCIGCPYRIVQENGKTWCYGRKCDDAADAIEELQKILEAVQKNSGINFRMWEEAQVEVKQLQAQLPKRGEWIRINKHTIQCPICRRYLDTRGVNAGRGDANYCPNCGAKLEVQDADS